VIETNPLRKIVLILILSQFFFIPAYSLTPDIIPAVAPIWSDQAGTREVLVQCSGDGKYVVSGSDTGILRMYDQTGKILWTFQRVGKMVRSIAISGRGESVGAVFLNPDAPSYYADGEILFFNRAGDILWNYSDDYTIERIAISDNGNSIYASGSPKVYSFAQNGTVTGLNESLGRTWVLTAADDGSYAVAGETIIERVHIAGSKSFVNRVYAIEKDGTLSWNYSTRNDIASIGIAADGGSIVTAAGYQLLSFSQNGTLIWQLNSGPDITSIAMSSDGEFIAVGSQYYARLFNRSGSLIWRYEYDGFVHDIGISDDGKLIIAGGSGGVYVFDRKGEVLWNYPTPTAIQHVSMANDGEYFAAGSADTVYFFSRYGNATISSDPENLALNRSSVPTNMTISPQPTTKFSPLPPWLVIIAISGISIIVLTIRREG
jgi:WD40 repeat protein